MQNQVTETPSLVPDGTNTRFSFTLLPASTADIHLFFKGLEMIQGPDFTIDGQTAVLARPIETKEQHLLRINFESQFGHAGTASARTDVSKTDPIVRSILMRAALRKDEPATFILQNAPQAVPRNSAPDVQQYRSISILASRMRTSPVSAAPRRGKRRSSPYAVNLQGVDGIGDTFAGGNYLSIRGYSHADIALPVDRTLVRGAGQQPRSVMMLQERLESIGTPP